MITELNNNANINADPTPVLINFNPSPLFRKVRDPNSDPGTGPKPNPLTLNYLPTMSVTHKTLPDPLKYSQWLVYRLHLC